jgi:hypothetical protein
MFVGWKLCLVRIEVQHFLMRLAICLVQEEVNTRLDTHSQVTFCSGHIRLPGLSELRVRVQELRFFPGQKSLQLRAVACAFDLRGHGREVCGP